MKSGIKKLLQILNPILFFGVIAVLSLSTLLSKKESFSELENRYLAELPQLSARSWFSSDYSEGLSEYADEHFALRPRWISLRTSLERLGGHDEVNGVYFSDRGLFEVMPPVNYERIDRSVSALNSFGSSLDGRLSVMIVPTASQIYADSLPSYSRPQEQRRMINYVYSALDESIGSIDVYDALFSARDDYIYYRTDRHWTTYGAYVAYAACVRRLGYNPVTIDRINIEHASHSFLGSLYSDVLSDDAEPDTVDFYTSGGAAVTSVKVTHPDGSVCEHDGVIFRENLGIKDKYQCFLGENVPLIEIESEAGGGSVLVIKDSYANCFVPFLTKHFSKVTVVDLRYMMHLSDYCDPSEYDRVLILYNASTFASDTNISKLAVAEQP